MAKAMDEQAMLSEVVQRLTQRYPTLPSATIGEVVHQLHAKFDSAEIREYVPLLWSVKRVPH